MNQQEERQKVFDALKQYGEKHHAEYYCVILTPEKGLRVTIPGNMNISSSSRGEAGVVIEKVVEGKVLLGKG
jgi:hypothetical protein